MGVRVQPNTYLLRVGILLIMFMAVLSKYKDKQSEDDVGETQSIEESTGESIDETEGQ